MCRFIESIRVEKGRFQHLEWHEKRFNETRHAFFPLLPALNLSQALTLPAKMDDGVYKCRVVYGPEIMEVTWQPYLTRNVRTLRLVVDNAVDYAFKYEHREVLQQLMALKGDADDVLIVKDGCITDTSYSNVALFDGFHWYTPDTYLLNGTCRQRLLSEGILREAHITLHDLSRFEEVRPINAMLELDQTLSVKLIF
jgi:4-amino-4-deoxychorismate lyase